MKQIALILSLITITAIHAKDDLVKSEQTEKITTQEPKTTENQNPKTTQDQSTVTNEVLDEEPPRMLVFAPAPPTEYTKQKQELSQQFSRNLPDQDEARKRNKERKEKASYKKWMQKRRAPRKEHLTISQMNFHQLLQRKNELLLEGDYEVAIKYLEKMFRLTENAEQLVFIMLEWAELLMKTGQYAKAEKLFDDFIKLYPGNEYVEQAFVKAIECSWEQTANFDRDQTKTEDTLNLIKQFETRSAIYAKENIERVSEFKRMCQQKLVDSNLYVAQHYIGRGIYRSAHKRLDDARSNDLVVRPNIEPKLLKLEIELAQAEQNKTIEQTKLNELIEKFPDHEITLALKPTIQDIKQVTA
ncbi:MAG: outer membrane protein assembly factor BamD [Candidatus Dependentiae bacterium]